jgi:hypothetical protein
MKKSYSTVIILILIMFSGSIGSQTIEQPDYALKSHPTLEIKKIELTGNKSTIYLSIENRISGGAFCADANIYLLMPDGNKIMLTESGGIPVCPDSHVFKEIGEKLDFTLEFPSVKSGTEWFDIVEGCSDNCFSFYGVLLNSDINKNINEAYTLIDKGDNGGAVTLLKGILDNVDSRNLGIEGALYTDIISLSSQAGDTRGAQEWYKRMLLSGAPRLELFIKNLNSLGIKY